jgi:hypothetical protein
MVTTAMQMKNANEQSEASPRERSRASQRAASERVGGGAARAKPPRRRLWKRCGRKVENLCTRCATRSIFAQLPRKSRESHDRGADSHRASLARRRTDVTIHFLVSIVRYQQTINGKSYVIEVLSVGPARWRAQIARLPGAPTALMPFYGATPDEAAESLSGWLVRAGGQGAAAPKLRAL